jgi:hypothetical protein
LAWEHWKAAQSIKIFRVIFYSRSEKAATSSNSIMGSPFTATEGAGGL